MRACAIAPKCELFQWLVGWTVRVNERLRGWFERFRGVVSDEYPASISAVVHGVLDRRGNCLCRTGCSGWKFVARVDGPRICNAYRRLAIQHSGSGGDGAIVGLLWLNRSLEAAIVLLVDGGDFG